MSIENVPSENSQEKPFKEKLNDWSKFLIAYGMVMGKISVVMIGVGIATAGFGLGLPERIIKKFNKTNIGNK